MAVAAPLTATETTMARAAAVVDLNAEDSTMDPAGTTISMVTIQVSFEGSKSVGNLDIIVQF